MKPSPRLTLVLILALTGALSACGGGGGEPAAATGGGPVASGGTGDSGGTGGTDSGTGTGTSGAPTGGGTATGGGTTDAGTGTGTDAGTGSGTGSSGEPPVALSDEQRVTAARATAESADNACGLIRPFYWEIGDSQAATVSGSVNRVTGNVSINAASRLLLASASKWLYAAYVAEVDNGSLSALDVQFLTMRGGYTHLDACARGDTVDSCLATGHNGDYDASTDGRFYYNGGHMQKHASLIGLGAMTAARLGATLRGRLGEDTDIGFAQVLVAGGAHGTPAGYAIFLRKLMRGDLRLGSMLGRHAVCASLQGCGSEQALYSPAPAGETLHYALGHWVEDDPNAGDGAFSSAGALGFYPWISTDRQRYGIVARQVNEGGPGSLACGRLIRRAWQTGLSQ